MADDRIYSNVLQQVQVRFSRRTAPHKLADNDNDYPPAVPARAAAARAVAGPRNHTPDGLLT